MVSVVAIGGKSKIRQLLTKAVVLIAWHTFNSPGKLRENVIRGERLGATLGRIRTDRDTTNHLRAASLRRRIHSNH
jgi:FAD synthase